MEKPTNSELYLFGNDKIELLSYFLYEVTIYEITKNRVRLLASKYYKSNKELKLKGSISKKYRNKLIIKNVSLLGVPFEFIKEKKLKKYQPLKKKK